MKKKETSLIICYPQEEPTKSYIQKKKGMSLNFNNLEQFQMIMKTFQLDEKTISDVNKELLSDKNIILILN